MFFFFLLRQIFYFQFLLPRRGAIENISLWLVACRRLDLLGDFLFDTSPLIEIGFPSSKPTKLWNSFFRTNCKLTRAYSSAHIVLKTGQIWSKGKEDVLFHLSSSSLVKKILYVHIWQFYSDRSFVLDCWPLSYDCFWWETYDVIIGQLRLVASVQAVLTCIGNANWCSTRFWHGV